MAVSSFWISFFVFFLVALVSFLFSWGLCHTGLLDHPVQRSSHRKPTPTTGGIAFVAACGVGALALAFLPFPAPVEAMTLAKLLGLSLCAAGFGLWDDMFVPGALFKLVFMVFLSLAAAWILGPITQLEITGALSFSLPMIVALLGSGLWIFIVMNAVNFMDGANGMLGGSLGVASLCLAGLCAWDGAFMPMVAALGLAGVLLGFLPWNMGRKARLFAGDTGALFVSFMFATTSLIWAADIGQGRAYAAVLLLAPWLGDVGLTLVWRMKKGRPLLQAHRDHHYQLALRAGWSHRRVAITYAAIGLGFALIATMAMALGPLALIMTLFIAIMLACLVSIVLRGWAYRKNLDKQAS